MNRAMMKHTLMKHTTMKHTAVAGTMLSLLLFYCCGVLVAAAEDELPGQTKQSQKEAAIKAEHSKAVKGKAEQSKADEAEKLKGKAEAFLSKARGLDKAGEHPEQTGIDQQARQLKERHQQLLDTARKLQKSNASEKELAEIHEQIAVTSRELHALHGPHGAKGEPHPEHRAQVEKLEAATRRIHHLRVAAENLNAAESHDLAHQVAKQAAEMERDVQAAKQQLAAEMQKSHGGAQGSEPLSELRAEVERLRAEVKELRQKVENR